MPSVDSSIVKHKMKMHPDVKLVRHWLQPIHPKKATAIKVEVEKLLQPSFIYPIPLTDSVSNIIPREQYECASIIGM